MHDRLFAHPHRLSSSDLLDHAAVIGLDVPRFARDLGSSRYARRVRHDTESARASGVTGTPTFFVGGRRHTGPRDAETLAAALAAAAGEDTTPAPPAAATTANLSPDEEERPVGGVLPDLPEDLPETPAAGGTTPGSATRRWPASSESA